MTPSFEIKVGDVDYTATIMDRLVELRLVDMPGYKSDYMELVLDDRDTMPRPSHGEKIFLLLGYRGQPLTRKGTYIHDETAFEGPLKRMTISASAINFKNKLPEQRSRSFDNLKLGDLVASIASDHGYSAYVDDALKNITIPHLDQTNESDLALLTRLGTQYDALFKAVGTSLLFISKGGKRGEAEKNAIGTTTLTPGDISTWNVQRQDKSLVTGVMATWYDLDAAQLKSVMVGTDESLRTLSSPYPTEEEANAAAQSKLNRLNRATASLSITMPGNPKLTAEGGLTLEGFRDGVDDEYTITRVEHTITKSRGYKCKVQAELAK